ncbi:HpsJ family protein [Leptolyngbya sp. CCY15150]|uniref:HpsJ-like protein, cyanoexosortase A-associated n=1 Tax=Leptolyngbya sp. CCY15150 TaxID=2767772 RepID=UPI00194E030F|nr:HpsJ family protein [Leptolyngbya sp. CCY15150]
MANSSDDLPQIIEGMRQFNLSISKSIAPFRWVGYGLLVLAFLSWVAFLTPLNLMNPTWEFQAIGGLVERVPVLLLAFLLIFFGEMSFRKPWERPIIHTLSWLCLVLGLLFFLMMPLGIVNTFRINQQNAVTATTEYNRQLEEAANLEAELDRASTADILAFLESQGAEVNLDNPDQVKDLLRDEINAGRASLTEDYNELRANQRLSLFKNSVQWNLGALLSGVLLVYIWRSTAWARGKHEGS